MKKTRMVKILVLALMVCAVQSASAGPMGTAFTYQGQLYDASYPANGLYDFAFKLYDASSEGNQIGSDVNVADVNAIDGYFTVKLDFDSGVFGGEARWLRIGVRPGVQNDPCAYTLLSPRQEVTPAPHAIYAEGSNWNKLTNVPADINDGDDVGITSETDPTVLASVKDGIAWTEVSDRPAGLDDGDDVGSGVPAGVIVMWSGSIDNIPSGWALCDGTSGTPDLRNRFIMGAGSSYSVGNAGGEASHTLTINEMPAHSHSYNRAVSGSGWGGDDGSQSTGNIVENTGVSGSGAAHNNLPPYYALAYIMKL